MLMIRRVLLAAMLAISISGDFGQTFAKAAAPADTLGPPRVVEPGAAASGEQDPVPDPTPQPPAPTGVKLKAPKFGKPATAIPVTIDGEVKEGDAIFWMVLKGREILGPENVYLFPDQKGLILTGDKHSEPYRVLLLYKPKDGKNQEPVIAEIQIGDPAPVPPIPVPDPNPKPVDPKPDVPPVVALPIKAMFLIDEDKLTQELSDAVNSVDLRKWMDENASKDAEGRPEFRVWDDDYTDEQILVRNSQQWLSAYKQAKADRAKAGKGDDDPWMMVTNTKDGGSLSIPLPRELLYDYLKKCREGKFDGK